MESRRLDFWRKYFRGAESSIFDVIENAILVAGADHPAEFRSRRDRIAELLFACRTRCLGCDRVELRVPVGEEEAKLGGGGGGGGGSGGDDDDDDGRKDDRVNSSGDDRTGMAQVVSNESYDEAEALTEEIEEESQTIGEVLRIKEVLKRKNDESESVLFESLRRLQLMTLTYDVLKATQIGRTVNGLRKHKSIQIRNLVQTLVDGWKVMVDEYIEANAVVLAEDTPQSMNPACSNQDEGLPSPPLDEGGFLPTQTPGMEVSQFFDGIDDDKNPINYKQLHNDQENGRMLCQNRSNTMRMQATGTPALHEHGGLIRFQDSMNQIKQQERINQSTSQGSSDRPSGLQDSLHKQLNSKTAASIPRPSEAPCQSNLHKHPSDMRQLVGKPPIGSLNKSRNTDDNSVCVKMEFTKRKLQEGYQQADNAKKQRKIQILPDVPKQGVNERPPQLKPGTTNQYRGNGRR